MLIKTNKAFTLIELLIVVSVISLISTVVLYQTGEARQKADDAHMKQEVQEVRKAIELYRDDNGSVPFTVSYNDDVGLGEMVSEDDNDSDKKTAYEESMQILVDGGYLPEIPRSPDGTSYSYMATADGNAVFAANLNNSSSNSGTNSCEWVGSNLPFSSCAYTGLSKLLGITCDDYSYNEDEEYCFVVLGTGINEGTIPFCSEWNQNGDIDSIPNRVCDCEPRGEAGACSSGPCTCGNYGGWPAEDFGAIEMLFSCQKNEVAVCSGGSNSDYCSCI